MPRAWPACRSRRPRTGRRQECASRAGAGEAGPRRRRRRLDSLEIGSAEVVRSGCSHERGGWRSGRRPRRYGVLVTDDLRVAQVFVPGKLPAHTYNPRSELRLEQQLNDYVEEAGAILTVAGPTKTGKSVLLRRVVNAPAWVDGQGIEDVEELWRRIGDSLSAYTGYEYTSSQAGTGTAKFGSEVGFSPIVKVSAAGEYAAAESQEARFSIDRPIGAAARQALEEAQRPLVVDDFHFISHVTQRDIVRSLKPVVLTGTPVIFVSISHRVQDVVTAEPDMTGRLVTLDIDFWSTEELIVIARKGFEVLNLMDPDDRIAKRLAESSYGSPHLMQKFCREACKSDGVRETLGIRRVLNEPPDWSTFFKAQTDGASADWFQRLLRGPQERGSARTQWELKDGRTLDGYGLTLAAVAATGPKLSVTKDEIKASVENLVAGSAPAAHQTTRVLQNMTKIAAKRANEPLPSEEELDRQEVPEPESVPDVQPVLEYKEDGPSSALHIADPFFAFYLQWGSGSHLANRT